MVCKDGQCLACAADTACSLSDKPCRVGKISCSTGAASCTEADNQPNGQPCGADKVCLNGVCGECVQDSACAPANPCHEGKLDCSGAKALCIDTGKVLAPGTRCGTDKVCDVSGACIACKVGSACTPDVPCKKGGLTCDTGVPVCTARGALDNGTTCGASLVCSGGTCVQCAEGLSCVPSGSPCHAGSTVCSPSVACHDTGTAVSNGTSCGEDQVCNAGQCVACKSNATCSPANKCKNGVTKCDSGASSCVESTNVPNGTSCGNNLVRNDGACVACSSGADCAPTANPCHKGQLSCESGNSMCIDTGANAANGTSCGNNLVCNNGSCVSCIAGSACQPVSGNACHVGTTSCATGVSTCQETGTLPTGAACASDKVCDVNRLWLRGMQGWDLVYRQFRMPERHVPVRHGRAILQTRHHENRSGLHVVRLERVLSTRGLHLVQRQSGRDGLRNQQGVQR